MKKIGIFNCLIFERPTVTFAWWIGKKLTHSGRVTHICVGKLIIIGSDNGLSPERRQAIIWTNARILLIGLQQITAILLRGVPPWMMAENGVWLGHFLRANWYRIPRINMGEIGWKAAIWYRTNSGCRWKHYSLERRTTTYEAAFWAIYNDLERIKPNGAIVQMMHHWRQRISTTKDKLQRRRTNLRHEKSCARS